MKLEKSFTKKTQSKFNLLVDVENDAVRSAGANALSALLRLASPSFGLGLPSR